MKKLKHFWFIITSNKILVVILVLAAVLRFVGTNPGYNQFHADEGISYSAAVSMIKNGNLDPLRYDYPALVPEINYVFFKLIFIPFSWTKYYLTNISEIIDGVVHIPIAPLEEKKLFQVYVLGERNINALHWGRYVTALFSLANVFLTYLLAKRLFSKTMFTASTYIGLIAAFLLTFNYKHVINSHIGLPDIYNSFFVLLTLVLCVNLWRNPTTKNYLLTGIAVGLSFSVKYQIFTLFPLCLTHLYLSLDGFKVDFKKLFSPAFFASLVVIPLTFAILNPYFFVYFDEVIRIIKDVALKYGMGVKQINLYPFSYFYHIDYGPIEFIAACLGFLVAIIKFRKETLILLSYLIPFMFVIIYYSNGGFYVRNFITVTPIFMIFAAVAIVVIYELISRKLGSKMGVIILAFFIPVAVYIPARNSIISSFSYTQPWGYDIMRPWVQENLPTDVTIASHPFDAVNLKIKNKRTEFEIAGNFSLAEHKEHGAQYALLDLNWVGNPFYFWMSYGFADLERYWNKPLDIMRNMYHGIATEELFRYQLHAVTKPWQAPDTHLLVIKLPNWPGVRMSELVSFNFNNDLNEWEIYGRVEKQEFPYQFDPEVGKNLKGSLVFLPHGAEFPTVRMTSPLISIKEEYLYEIEGFLKTEKKLEAREREGFLRVDFYGQNPDLEKVGMIASVSSRVYGTDDWVRKALIERAPKGSKYLTVSFQTHITTRTKIWLDDVAIKQSEGVVEDITAKTPYNIRQMDLNYVYPNSHGNL